MLIMSTHDNSHTNISNISDTDGLKWERLQMMYYTSTGTLNTLIEQQNFVYILELFKLTPTNKR